MENATQLDEDLAPERGWLVNRTRLDIAEDYLPDWTDLLLAVCFSILIIITIVGNTLVIAAVITTRRLRSVTNCFVSSLAAADLLVGLAVMPPAVMLQLNGGTWELGEILCDSWVSLDVMLCTASILSLCAISIDRYLAVTQPLIYSRRRRSKRLAGLMIVFVWLLAVAITSPPLLGCFPRARNSLETEKKCSYNMDSSYVIFSAMGSFFLPMLVMLYVYGRISCVIAKRHRNLESTDTLRPAAVKPHRSPNVASEPDHPPAPEARALHFPTAHRLSAQRPTIYLSEAKEQQQYHHQQLQQQQQQQQYHHHQQQLQEGKEEERYGGGGGGGGGGCRSGRLLLGSARPSLSSVSEGTGPSEPTASEPNKSPALSGRMLRVPGALEPGPPAASSSAATGGARRPISRVGTLRSHQHSCVGRVTRETKTAGTLAVVVGGFVACWLPFFILYLATPFMPVDPPDPLMPALTWLGWINSAINPFIYAFYSADFRLAFWRLTCQRCAPRRPGFLDSHLRPAELRAGVSGQQPAWRRQTTRT